MIHATDLVHSYEYIGSKKRSLDSASVDILPGQFVAILGQNGCGKSTLAKHFNALLELQSGELKVAGIDVNGNADVWILRRKAGMVFQNPDNQFVSSIIEEDIAFGLENYGVPREEINNKVAEALKKTNMTGYEKRSPHTLSGGQKQRAALSGVLALDPDILIFDEATAMLDPEGRQEVLSSITELHKQGKTIVLITHYIEEAVIADRVFLMHHGKIIASGTPHEILYDLDKLGNAGLKPPTPVRLYYDLKNSGICLPVCPITNEELTEAICQLK